MRHQLISYWGPLVCHKLLLSCCFQECLFVLGFPQFDYNVSWCWSFSIYVTWRLLSFLNVYIHVFHQISEGFSYYFFKHSFCPFLSPSGTPTVCMLVRLMVSHRSHFINLFSFCSSALIVSIGLSSCLLILLPVQICLWISAVNFSFELLYFSAPEFLFGSFRGFLSLYSYFHFVHTLLSWLSSHLLLVLWASLR